MYVEVESQKDMEQAGADLEAAVKANGFGVLHVHDLGATLRKKGVDFSEECRVYEVCNPQQAAKVLATDMRLNNALPCRVSVYTKNGRTRIGFIKPSGILASMSNDESLADVAAQVEAKITQMVNDAK